MCLNLAAHVEKCFGYTDRFGSYVSSCLLWEEFVEGEKGKMKLLVSD